MTKVYFASSGDRKTDEATFGARPGIHHLVALQAHRAWSKARDVTKPGSWCLDSGAFEAFTQGKPIEYERWSDVASMCDADEIFGLDVIGDSKATRANVERAWSDGIKAIPTFHFGEPWEYLEWAASSAPKFALGGMARRRDSERVGFIRECFRRAWPCRVHGFGVTSRDGAMAAPFHSVDSSSWLAGRQYRLSLFNRKMGGYRRQYMPSKSTFRNQAIEIDSTVDFFRFVSFSWRKELAEMESLPNEWNI